MKRRKLMPGEKATIRITARDYALFQEYEFGDDEYVKRFKPALEGRDYIGEFSLNDLEDILGFVAFESNHTDDEKLEAELDALYDRLCLFEELYEDEE